MNKKLVIVESPSKSKTIEAYLGKDYKVVSSKGHIRDLATTGKFGLGVDVEDDFKPNYITIKGKTSLVKELKKDVSEASIVYLATDPDREGEAISWHLKDALKLTDKNYKRVLFNEITKDKVNEAINKPTMIDDNLVKSQETRRILDRIIGFRLSKLLQSKIKAKSAGRVQSVALKLIVDREREIEAFKSEEYYTVVADFTDYEATLFKYKDEDIKLNTDADAQKVLDNLNKEFIVFDINKVAKSKKSRPVFITSTLQQAASIKLGFSAKKTMMLAQKLYEGIKIENETVGLITYMRTDSIRLSDEFVKSAYGYISNNYGKEYIGYVKASKKKDNVQDAHEGIRPTSILREPLKVKPFLTEDEYKLYRIIYVRALASLMSDAKTYITTVIFDNNDYKFKTSGTQFTFDGYLKIYRDYEATEEHVLPTIEKDTKLIPASVDKFQHFTKPPSRYTEAKLIKEMEELGIGRPSTYAKTISTLKERVYVTIEEKKFVPTKMGILTTDKLQEFFKNLINVEYTKDMEEDLDKIALGSEEELDVLKNFYTLFEPQVEKAFGDMEKSEDEKTGEKCPLCESDLVVKKGRYGEFVACSNYPECKYIKKEKKEEKVIMDCPECKEGKIIERKTKRGKIFYGCNRYPKCKFASWDMPTTNTCKKCGSYLVIKNDKEICPVCDKEKKEKQNEKRK